MPTPVGGRRSHSAHLLPHAIRLRSMFSFSGASDALVQHIHGSSNSIMQRTFPVKPLVEATRKRATYVRADVRAPTNSLTDAQIIIRLLLERRSNEMLSKELHHLVNLSSSAEICVRVVDRPPRTSTSSLAREFIWQQQEDQRNLPHTCAK